MNLDIRFSVPAGAVVSDNCKEMLAETKAAYKEMMEVYQSKFDMAMLSGDINAAAKLMVAALKAGIEDKYSDRYKSLYNSCKKREDIDIVEMTKFHNPACIPESGWGNLPNSTVVKCTYQYDRIGERLENGMSGDAVFMGRDLDVAFTLETYASKAFNAAKECTNYLKKLGKNITNNDTEVLCKAGIYRIYSITVASIIPAFTKQLGYFVCWDEYDSNGNSSLVGTLVPRYDNIRANWLDMYKTVHMMKTFFATDIAKINIVGKLKDEVMEQQKMLYTSWSSVVKQKRELLSQKEAAEKAKDDPKVDKKNKPVFTEGSARHLALLNSMRKPVFTKELVNWVKAEREKQGKVASTTSTTASN